jgi:hypothetical protein
MSLSNSILLPSAPLLLDVFVVVAVYVVAGPAGSSVASAASTSGGVSLCCPLCGALNWVTHFYGDTVVAIPGASKPQQAQDSADALGFRLTDKELTRLDKLSR